LKFGALRYNCHNLGDEIQTLAAMQFLPRVDYWVNRDAVSDFRPADPDEKVALITNGWFSWNARKWPPPDCVIPLLISLCICQSRRHPFHPLASKEMTSKKSVEFFRKHEPVGCRDIATLELLNKFQVRAYFSGCLTLSFEEDLRARTDEICVVDPCVPFGRIRSWLPQTSRQHLQPISHFTWIHDNISKKMQMAKSLLERYARARLVITSRLHCALPAMTMGTPALFIIPKREAARFLGYEEILEMRTPEEACRTLGDIQSILPSFESKKGAIKSCRDKLRATCASFINSVKDKG